MSDCAQDGSRPQTVPIVRTKFSSADEAEITDFIRHMYADSRLDFGSTRDQAHFSALTHDTAVIGADRIRTSIDYRGSSAQGFDDYLFFTVNQGRVEVRSRDTGSSGDVSFYPRGVPIGFDTSHFDATVLRLPGARIEQVSESITGLPADQLRFHDVNPVSASMKRYWKSLMNFVASTLMQPDSPLNSPLLAEDMARTVATAAFHTFPNTAMTRQYIQGPGAIGSATVRRAAAYIETYAHLPLQLHEIAAAAGTSDRALQDGFRRHLDSTPFAYLRRVRLERARQELQLADPTRGDTVSAVARRWGFANAGRFARTYRAAYGVNPAHTLRG